MSADFMAAVFGNAIAGFGVWILSAVLAWSVSLVRARRRRRRSIISLVARAHNLAQTELDAGTFDQAWNEKSDLPLREAKKNYDDLSSQALNLFEPAETEVAFWCAVELYAGWRSPHEWLRNVGATRRRGRGGQRLLGSSLYEGWLLPRTALLADWADVRWPWDIGNARGPQYAVNGGPGDTLRHGIVPPNTDVNGDMVRAYANIVSPPRWEPTRRQARRLAKMFPNEEAENYRELIADVAAATTTASRMVWRPWLMRGSRPREARGN